MKWTHSLILVSCAAIGNLYLFIHLLYNGYRYPVGLGVPLVNLTVFWLLARGFRQQMYNDSIYHSRNDSLRADVPEPEGFSGTAVQFLIRHWYWFLAAMIIIGTYVMLTTGRV